MSNEKLRRKLIEAKRQLTPKDLHYQEIKEKLQGKPADVKKSKNRVSRLRSLKKQWEPYDTAILKYIDKKVKDSGNLLAKIERLEESICNDCPHPVECLEVDEVHNAGDDFTDFYVKCNQCSLYQKVERVNHSYHV